MALGFSHADSIHVQIASLSHLHGTLSCLHSCETHELSDRARGGELLKYESDGYVLLKNKNRGYSKEKEGGHLGVGVKKGFGGQLRKRGVIQCKLGQV